MIPLKLQLKNFLSYGAELQTVDFTPFNLICLSGKNGHGKSALLDAMCWAIWGEARKISVAAKPDQGLLRLGQRNMKVIFDFEFNQQLYRIRREFTFAYNKPYALLEFGLVDPASGELISLTDKTIKATQAKIVTTLGLSYAAFVNSAFLRQGQSHEFSKKSPSERKQVLGEMLGIDQYEQLRKLALEKIKLAEADKQVGEKLQAHWAQELQRLPAVQSAVQQAKADLVVLDSQLQTLIAEQAQLEKTLNQQQNLSQLHTQKLTQLQTVRQQWRTTHYLRLKLHSAGANLTQLQQQRQALVAQAAHLQTQQQQVQTLRHEILTLQLEQQTGVQQRELALHQLTQQITYQEQQLQQQIANLAKLTQELSEQQTTLANLQQQIAHSGILSNTEARQYLANFEQRKELYQQLVTQGNFCQSRLSQLRTRLLTWEGVLTAQCQTCEQLLTPAQQQRLQAKLSAQQQQLQQSIQTSAQLLKLIKHDLVNRHMAVQEQVQVREQLNLWRVQAQQLTTQLAALSAQQAPLQLRVTQDQAALAKLQVELQQQQAQLTNLQQQYQQQLAAREQALNSLGDITGQQTQVTQALTQLELVLQSAQDSAPQQVLQQERLQMLQLLVQEAKQLQAQLQPITTLTEQQTALVQKLTTIQAQKLKLVQQLGAYENQQAQLLQIQSQVEQQQAQLKTLAQAINDYREIAAALGKEGIQALLLEEALPEIECAANQLLARLTDNQMQLMIESLRDLKKGGAKETLDLKITDGVGVRPYEMFSGGEAFRIDFALRIAISQLLAQRAGTSLQTLIIDEGFGSQDEEGLGYIMDALYKIQADFAKVIIVSHLPAIKNQFPVHFMVEKSAAGSQITVLEQG